MATPRQFQDRVNENQNADNGTGNTNPQNQEVTSTGSRQAAATNTVASMNSNNIVIQPEPAWSGYAPHEISGGVQSLLLGHNGTMHLRFHTIYDVPRFEFVLNRRLGTGGLKIIVGRHNEAINVQVLLRIREHELDMKISKDGQVVKDLLPGHFFTKDLPNDKNYSAASTFDWDVRIVATMGNNSNWILDSCTESYQRPWDQNEKTIRTVRGGGDVMRMAGDAARCLLRVGEKHCYSEEKKAGETFVFTQ